MSDLTYADTANIRLHALQQRLDVPETTTIESCTHYAVPALRAQTGDYRVVAMVQDDRERFYIVEYALKPDGQWHMIGSVSGSDLARAAEHIHWRACVAAGVSA